MSDVIKITVERDWPLWRLEETLKEPMWFLRYKDAVRYYMAAADANCFRGLDTDIRTPGAEIHIGAAVSDDRR